MSGTRSHFGKSGHPLLECPLVGAIRKTATVLEVIKVGSRPSWQDYTKVTVPPGPGLRHSTNGVTVTPGPRALPKFPGVGWTSIYPADPDVAAGPNHLVQVVNSQIAFFTRTGAVQFQQLRRAVPGSPAGPGPARGSKLHGCCGCDQSSRQMPSSQAASSLITRTASFITITCSTP